MKFAFGIGLALLLIVCNDHMSLPSGIGASEDCGI
jgi:hypothetical protein